MLKYITLITFFCTTVYAQEPTVIYGASELSDKEKDAYLLVQPDNAPNPLGDPIVYVPQRNEQQQNMQNISSSASNQEQSLNRINQAANQNPPPFQETPQEQNNQIDTTLYQGGNRIYDIQSYPLKDINKITEPNIQPTITTYPAY